MAVTTAEPGRDIGRLRALVHQVGWYCMSVGLFLVLWYLASNWVSNRTLLPSPIAVFEQLVDFPQQFLSDAWISLRRYAAAYIAAGVLGIPLGLAMGAFQAVGDIFDAFVEILRPIPAIAWIPVALLLFGIGDEVPIFIIFYAAFFPFVVSTYAGVRDMDKGFEEAALTLGADRRIIFWEVIVPGSLPAILSGARTAVGLGWMAVIAAELVGSSSGLGYLITWNRYMLRTHRVIAGMVVIGILGFTVSALLTRLYERMAPWSKQ